MIAPEILPLTPERSRDFLDLFDHRAFPPGHHWASCYCYAYQSGCSDDEWARRTAPENRADSLSLIEAGEMRGHLAYFDGRAVAWCHAAPHTLVRTLREEPMFAIPDADRVGAIMCFVVSPGYRRRGLGRMLLDAACEGFAREGLAIAEAYPRKNVTADDANYKGPAAMYGAAGFAPYREHEKFTIVRKRLIA